MIDSHTHLYACEPADELLVADAERAGVRRILTVGTDPASCVASLAAADAFPAVWAAIGCHPNNAGLLDEALLRAQATHPRCAAIGETGLDFYRDAASPADQHAAFTAQIELAREFGKPLVIHTRAADAETLAILREHAGDLRVLLHCFSMHEHVAECIAAGWWISFAGNVTYPANAALADAAEIVPLERLLVETDAPYLAPQSRRGRPNAPDGVVETARFIAQRRRIPYGELEAALESCAAELFGW